MKSPSKVIKSAGNGWDDVEPKEYKTEGEHFRGVTRHTLFSDEIPELNFHTRYFEIETGGYSSLERHRHPHTVIILRGRGSVVMDNEISDLESNDAVYIAPNTIHQFHADKGQALGFLCIVDRYRDKPQIPGDKEIGEIIRSEKILEKIKK
jgi:quercetin dioxygenase-like cupin family protein